MLTAAKLHQLQGRENRRQRVAQLVPEHRQEFVLGPIRRFGSFSELIHLIPRQHLFCQQLGVRFSRASLVLYVRVRPEPLDDIAS